MNPHRTGITLALMLGLLTACGEPGLTPPEQSGTAENAGPRTPQQPGPAAPARRDPAVDQRQNHQPPVTRLAEEKALAGPGAAAFDALANGIAANPGAQLRQLRAPREPLDRENYAHFADNPVKLVAEAPVSTFSIDVDTGSYTNVRRMLNEGRLPVQDAVRVEEMLNYFDYAYPAPANRDTPFRVTTELGPNPWNAHTRLLQIGIKGFEVAPADIPAANLVFLIDVSGSMQTRNKLALLKEGMKLLARRMRPQDTVAIVVYAGASGVVLEPTPAKDRFAIIRAIDQLQAGGSTNGAAGIRLAYQLAESAFIKDGVNRILLATDGDFNVGTTGVEQLIDLAEAGRESGIGLSTLGFGTGNYNDHLMEQLADAGNGTYAYIDTLNEANRVLVEQLSATLLTIARDVKVQVEFNPAVVSEYRLIGYENRRLRREDFNNDRVDAGDIGAGHTVTALYEIALTGTGGERVDPLRYGGKAGAEPTRHTGELAFLRLRYKQPGARTSRLMQTPIRLADMEQDLAATSDRYRFACAVAGFGQKLRGGRYLEGLDYPAILDLARGSRGADRQGARGEFLQLVSLAASLSQAGPGLTEQQVSPDRGM